MDIKIVVKTILVVLGADGIKTGQKFEEVDDVGLKDLIEKKQKESEKMIVGKWVLHFIRNFQQSLLQMSLVYLGVIVNYT